MGVKYRTTFVYEHDDGETTRRVTVETETLSEQVKDAGWVYLTLEEPASYQTVRERWSRVRTIHEYANQPWDDSEELENALRSIDGVSNVVYNDPYSGAYGPPKYHLRVEGDASPTEVAKQVEKYYEGLGVSLCSQSVEVVVSPTLGNT